ncbi:hypothetical protein RJ639_002194 [Escallonia herrerae]|uniref:Integrase catalytic domain-containing protein n=1 Tax=Escallonia herrerae TaxID=1293975 RepID=A0AA89BM59_9ASTE|nr:hypothetical protein RJ639_002194 [Escallonia herrerae]
MIRSDRSKEYNSKQFDQFCEEEGVKHQLRVTSSGTKYDIKKEEQKSHGDGKIYAEGKRTSKNFLSRSNLYNNISTEQVS